MRNTLPCDRRGRRRFFYARTPRATRKRTHRTTHNIPSHKTHTCTHMRQSSLDYWSFCSPISSVLAPPVVLRSDDREIPVELSYALIGKLAAVKMATLSRIRFSRVAVTALVFAQGYFSPAPLVQLALALSFAIYRTPV